MTAARGREQKRCDEGRDGGAAAPRGTPGALLTWTRPPGPNRKRPVSSETHIFAYGSNLDPARFRARIHPFPGNYLQRLERIPPISRSPISRGP
jgi:hypothetical protein